MSLPTSSPQQLTWILYIGFCAHPLHPVLPEPPRLRPWLGPVEGDPVPNQDDVGGGGDLEGGGGGLEADSQRQVAAVGGGL